jgi:hypothetical protein
MASSAPRIDSRLRETVRHTSVSVLVSPDVYGRTYSFATTKELLRQTNLVGALEPMALLNTVAPEIVALGRLDSNERARHLVPLFRFLFSRSAAKRALAIWFQSLREPTDLFTPLSPWACAAMTEACLRYCHETAGAAVNPPAAADYFGRILLSFQDRLFPPRIARPELDLENLSESEFSAFTRNFLHSNLHVDDFPNDFPRHYALFDVEAVGEVLREKEHVSAAQWLRSIIGMTPADYRFTLIALAGAAKRCSLKKPDTAGLIWNVDRLLHRLTPEARAHFVRLNDLAVIDVRAIRQHKAAPVNWVSAVYRTNILQRRQLIRLGEGTYFMLHPGLYLERYFHGLVHLLDDAARSGLGSDSWQRVRARFGHLFEGYVRWILRQMFARATIARFGANIDRAGDTDAFVVLGRTALVFECNHHYLSGPERYNSTAPALSAIIEPDLRKAIETARAVAGGQVVIEGRTVEVDEVLPIAVLPDALPINLANGPSFHRHLATVVPHLDGGNHVLPAQIITQSHLEYFDRAWRLPEEAESVVAFLRVRARSQFDRFTSRRQAQVQMRVTHAGNILGPVAQAAESEFLEMGPARFGAQ